MKKQGQVIRTHAEALPVRLSPDELRARGEKLAALEGQHSLHRAESKAQAKARKEEEGRLELDIFTLAAVIREKAELRLVDVEVCLTGNGTVVEVRLDTGEVLCERAIRDKERQEELIQVTKGDA